MRLRVDLVVRFHVMAKGGTFIDEEYRFNARKRNMVSKKVKTLIEQTHQEHFQHFSFIHYNSGKEVVNILSRLLLVVWSPDIIDVLHFHFG